MSFLPFCFAKMPYLYPEISSIQKYFCPLTNASIMNTEMN
ncbi:hypothetical protein SynSYN20_02921 [Synechococcus sp. SYN20]|nr:hypothetical protein SynSYN20_02921 [Synechococcus sp. SYN20]